MLKKKTVIDQIEITRDGCIQIRSADLFIEDDVELAKTYHRHVLSPGDSTEGESDRVKAVAKAVWTPEVVEAYEEKMVKEKDKLKE